MIKQRTHLVLAAVFGMTLLLLGLAWALSPRIYASSIESALQTGDFATLAKRLDASGLASTATSIQELIPTGSRVGNGQVLDEQFRKNINASIQETIGSDSAFVEKMANLLTGRGMVTQKLISQLPRDIVSRRTPDFGGESGPTYDTYYFKVAFRETGEQVSLTLERKGWFTWRAARLAISGGTVLWPVRLSKS
jgi:hypothetical protein